MTLNDYVDEVFVVNLPHRTDRIERFDELSKQHNFTYKVFDGLYGKDIPNDFQYNGVTIGEPYINERYFKAHIGCLISHLNIIKHAKDKNYDSIMIFEDDCGFCDTFNERLEYLMGRVDSDWQMLYLCGTLPEFTEQFEGYNRVKKILTTHSYMLKSSLYDTLINHLTKNIFTKEVDMCYSDIHPICLAYVAMPFLTYQEAGYSDVGDQFLDYGSTREHL